jgi:hypothetical protein
MLSVGTATHPDRHRRCVSANVRPLQRIVSVVSGRWHLFTDVGVYRRTTSYVSSVAMFLLLQPTYRSITPVVVETTHACRDAPSSIVFSANVCWMSISGTAAVVVIMAPSDSAAEIKSVLRHHWVDNDRCLITDGRAAVCSNWSTGQQYAIGHERCLSI